jgi:tetratricopeptide (TPR) repeat protein
MELSMRVQSLLASALAVGFGLTGAATLASAQSKDAPKPAPSCDKFKKGSADWKRCTGSVRDDLTDEQLYYAGYWLARTEQYQEALAYLSQSKVQNERVLTYIGFATRKLGDHETAMGFYDRALALNANYTTARAYLGEAFLARGDVVAAQRQLTEIETRCGKACPEYAELAGAIAQHTN